MDFNIKKIASDASGFFSRAKQYTEETFLKAEKTELDPHFETLLTRADKTEEHTRKLLSCIESFLQPNPTVRMEEVFYEKLELRKEGGRLNNLEHLAQAMIGAGEEFGANSAYGSALLKVAHAEQKIGQNERELVAQCASNTLLPIRRFLEGDMKTIQKERKVLNGKRLDLDACKSRLKKARSLEAQSSGNSRTSGGFSVEQAEADLRVAQAEFDKQSEITKLLLEGIQTAHMSFYAQAHQHMADLQRELSGTLLLGNTSAVLLPAGSPRSTYSKTPSSGKSLDPDDLSTKQARALMDYDAVLPAEISVLIVYRLPGMDPEFIMAEKGGSRGRVPISFLEIL